MAITFSSAATIDSFFVEKTGKGFVDWFNTNHSNIGAFGGKNARSITNKTNWSLLWTNIGRYAYTKTNNSFNLIEFIGLNTIILNEIGGEYAPVSEYMTSVNHATNPGIAYAFNAKGKRSYNTLEGQINAYQLFRDPHYLAQHNNLPYASQLANTTDTRWSGTVFPSDVFTNLKDAVRTSPATFLTEADFYKFRGRGFFGTTGRDPYSRLVKFVLAYTGPNAKILSYKTRWQSAPYSSNINVILTRSTNIDWDDLFQHTDLIIPINAMVDHMTYWKNYQYINPTIESEVQAKLEKMALRVGGGHAIAYRDLQTSRMKQQFDSLNSLL